MFLAPPSKGIIMRTMCLGLTPAVLSPPRLTSERKRRGQPRRHILKREGLDLAEVKVKSLDWLVDLRGNPCSSEVHVLKVLQDAQGQAGIMGERFWNHLAKEQPNQFSGLKTLWISRPFSHCVFTACKDFERSLAYRFSKLMLAMDPNDPATAEIMRLEGTRKWVAGSPKGFQELLKTLQEEAETCGSAGSNQGLRTRISRLGALGKLDLPLLYSQAGQQSNAFCSIDRQDYTTFSGTSAP